MVVGAVLLAELCGACGSTAIAKEPSAAVGGTGGASDGGAGTGAAGAPCVPSARRSEDISVSNDFGVLTGTLELPAGCAPFPTVLILAGSGPTDRNGNPASGGGVNTLKLLAEALASRGVASVRYDKAGVAASVHAAPASERDFSFDMYVNDAERWLKAMRDDARIGEVTIAGHSEGALIGMLAAKRVAPAGYISLAGAGRPAGVVIREQLGRQISDAALLAKIDRVLAELAAGREVAVDDLPSSVANLFRPSVQPYLMSWMKYDPAAEIRGLGVRTLLVQGTTDIQVSVTDAQLLAAAKPDAKLDIVEDMMHELKHATSDEASQQLAYMDPSLPVVAEVIDRSLELVLGLQP
jgi:pimeloyl-ACP methyl ester carboxylesterase